MRALFCQTAVAVAALVSLTAGAALAQPGQPEVSITLEGDRRCVVSNGVPNHDIGAFPNRGNPHSFRSQRHRYCFDATPERGSTPRYGTPIVAVALNGIPARPGTADWYDRSSPRGHSRDSRSGWNLEGMGSADKLGMDANNAHVDNRGIYHYHGVPPQIARTAGGTLVGYAADGFEVHDVGADAKPSYRLKAGTRPSAPGGRYDGRYLQDWEHVPGSGNLDECNGGLLDGRYVYFVTETFPYWPRCHWGEVSSDFRPRRGGAPGGPGGPGGPGFGGPGHPPGPPPPGHRRPRF